MRTPLEPALQVSGTVTATKELSALSLKLCLQGNHSYAEKGSESDQTTLFPQLGDVPAVMPLPPKGFVCAVGGFPEYEISITKF